MTGQVGPSILSLVPVLSRHEFFRVCRLNTPDESLPLSSGMPSGNARTTTVRGARLGFALVLMALSGAAGLGYQIVWTQQLGIWLGHEMIAVLAVVAAFFGGLAAGAYASDRLLAKSSRPALSYAGCEAAIALWGVALSFVLPAVIVWLTELIGPQPSVFWQWSVAFFGTFFLLLPATAAMGATLPAIERVLARLRAEGYAIGSLYAANTFGALVGVLASSFVLIPLFGLSTTALTCAALNFLCAVAALVLWRGQVLALEPVIPIRAATRSVLVRLFVTGALGIGYEVLVVRVLSQVAEDTVYTFALLLAVYLLGTAWGGQIYQRFFSRTNDPERIRYRLLCVVAIACALGTLALWFSASIKTFVLGALIDQFGGVIASLAGEAVCGVFSFLLPTVAMGALFSHLCVEAKAAGSSFSKAIAANTVGAALAPLVFGVLLLPTLGSKFSLLLVAMGYLLLLPMRAWHRTAAGVPGYLALGLMVALAAFAPTLRFVDVPEGGRVVQYEDGARASVSVVEDAEGVLRLRINNRQQEGSNVSLMADARQAWLPLLLHSAPSNALFLGLGTGLTAGSASWDPSLHVDAVELLPEVVNAAIHFKSALSSTSETGPKILVADARRYVRSPGRSYDVIVADLFHPARSGAGSLYTVEHFTAVGKRLAPGGLFCQWLPLHQLDLGTLRSIIQSFLVVYPNASALLATNSLDTPVIGLIAHQSDDGFDPPTIRDRMQKVAKSARIQELHLEDEMAVFGSFIAGPTTLKKFAGDAPANTDNHPVVAHRAPFVTYAPDSSPRDRLIKLLHSLNTTEEKAPQLRPTIDTENLSDRIAAYQAARQNFIELGTRVVPSSDPIAMLTQIHLPMLDILRTSPDFRPAYDPLVNMARALASSHLDAARALLGELNTVQPLRPEANLMLQQISEH